MTSKERENYIRNAILVVDHSKAALVSLVELDLQNKDQKFKQFINTNQHEIYHLYNSSWCCQCPPGPGPSRSPRILHQSQMELLFDRTSKLPCHNTDRRSDDFCCSMAKSGLCTDVLDLTLARCLLVNFCEEIFWFSCLQFQSITFEDFLNHNKHELYHLWKNNTPCCQCPPRYTFPTNYPMLYQNDWTQMFNSAVLPCNIHRKRPSPGGMQSICSVAATPGITLNNLDPSVRRIILQHCCTLRMDVETLVQFRNQDYDHAKEGIMSDNDYNASVVKIERCILDIANVCNREKQFKQKLQEAKYVALDQTLFTQYQNNLMETITRLADINESVAHLAPTINMMGNKLATKTGKFPKLMDDCIKKGYDYQEQLMQRFNQALIKVKNQTHMAIDCHMEEETFVETNAVRKCVDWMDRKDVFVIIGGEGSGKSRIGLEILRQFGLTDEEFDLLKVIDFLQVMDIITDERKTVMLLDGVLPTKKCSYKNFTIDHTLDLLHARLCKGDVKFIFTLDSSNSNSFKGLLASHRLFENCCKIDLSSDRFSMKEGEKATLLLNFCKRFNVGITWDTPGYEGDSKDFYLDGKTVYEIAKTDPFIGYPKSCFMFTSDKRFLQLGINFFKHPDQSLIDEINSLRDCTDINLEMNISYALLVYMLLNTSSFDVNRIDISKLETIIESCGNCQRRRLFDSKVKKIAEQIDGRFLKQDTQTLIYHFKHPMINEAIAISYFEVNPSAVISVLNFDFIIDLIRLERDDLEKQKISLIVAKDMFGFLSKRLFILFENYYKKRSAEFMKTLCGSALILQNNPDFIGPLFKQFNNCTSQDTITIQIEDRHEHVSFHFPRALLWFLIQKHNVDKPIATVLHFIENDMKDKQYMEKVEASKKIVLACFYYLCDTNNSDMKLELCYGLINEYDIECNYDYSMQMALKTGNDTAVIFLLSQVSKEIDIVKLVLEVEHVEDIRRLCYLISTNIMNMSIEFIDTDDKTDILRILIRSVPQNFFNLRKSINTACSKLCKDLVTGILSDARNFTFDTGIVVNTACQNGWEDALKIMLTKKLCNQSEKQQIFTASCKDGMETFLKWMFVTDDPDELNIQQLVLHEFRCENFETVQNFILKLQDHEEMETMIKNLFTQFSLPIIPFIQWILEDTEKKIVAGNKNHLQRLYIVQWIYERFPNLQTDVRNTVYKTINDTCDSFVEILQWLNENTKVIDHPVTSLLEYSCRNNLQKIVKWILQTFDHNTLNIDKMIIEAYKARYHEIVAWSIINDDQNAINKSEVFDLAVYNEHTDVIHYLLENIDHKLLDIAKAVDIACRRGNLDIVEMLLLNVDYKEINVKEAIDNVFSGITFDTVKTLSDNENRLENYIDKDSECERIKIVKLMLETFDHKLFDMTTIMNTAYEQRWFDLIKWMIEVVEDSLLDINEMLRMACQSECLDIVTLLAEKNSRADKGAVMRTVLNHSSFNFIRIVIANIDISLIDLGEAMNEACRDGKSELVQRFIESANDIIDLNRLIQIACDRNWHDIVKWSIENIDNALLEIENVMNEACLKGNLITVKWLVENFDNKLFDMKEAMYKACGSENIDTVKWLRENIDNKLFDMKEAMNHACRWGNLDTVELLIEYFDNKLFDVTEAMNNACESEKLDTVKWLIENVDNKLFDPKEAMNHACRWGNLGTVKWLIENFDNKLFDMKEAMINACESAKLDTVEWLIENIDIKLFDMKEAMNHACRWGNLDTVKWFIENFDNKLFDIKEAMNNASESEEVDTVKWLIDNFYNKVFDMAEAMNHACRWGNLDTVKWLMENFDNKLCDIKEAMNNACDSENLDTVKWLIENFDDKLFDMKEAMNHACRWGNLDTVKWLIEYFDNKLFDMKEAMNNACESAKLDTVKWLIENFDNKLFNTKEAMNHACGWGNLGTVKWLIGNFDNKLFDIKEAMNNACESEKLDTVKWLIDNFDNKLFDMEESMNHACTWGNLGTVKWLIENFDNKLFDIKEAMNNACESEKLDTVKWLIDNFDNKLFDIKEAMNNAFDSEKLDTVKWLIENVDNKLFDIKEAMNNACRWGNLNTVKWLIENFDNKLFDIKEAMNNACDSENIDTVKWLIDNFDNKFFDMKEAMHHVCRWGKYNIIEMLLLNIDDKKIDVIAAIDNFFSGITIDTVKTLSDNENRLENSIDKITECERIKIVKLMLETFDHKLFDITTIINAAFQNRWFDLIKWLIEKVDDSLLDLNEILSMVSQSERLDIVRLLVKKIQNSKVDKRSVMKAECNKPVEVFQDSDLYKTRTETLPSSPVPLSSYSTPKHISNRYFDQRTKHSLPQSGSLLTTGIYCDGHFIDCDVDRSLVGSYSLLRKSGKGEMPIQRCMELESMNEFENLVNACSYLKNEQTCLTLLNENSFRQAVDKSQDLLSRLMLSYIDDSEETFIYLAEVLQFAMERRHETISMAIAWHLTWIYFTKTQSAFPSLIDIWPAFRCTCTNESEYHNDICSSKVVIVVQLDTDIVQPSAMFFSIEVIYFTNLIEENTPLANRTIPYPDDMPIPNSSAEMLFDNHRNITLICKSSLLTSPYGISNTKFEITACVKLYCKAKGFIPIGEKHFPKMFCCMPTKIVQGTPTLMTGIQIGSKIGTDNFKKGTIGGFVRFRGEDTFLTCFHVFLKASELTADYITLDDNESYRVKCYQNTSAVSNIDDGFVCGKIQVFGFGKNSEGTSIDAALIQMEKGLTIDSSHFTAKTGLQSCYLNDICIDYNLFRYSIPGPAISIVSIGAVSGMSNIELKVMVQKPVDIDIDPFEKSFSDIILEGMRDYVVEIIQELHCWSDLKIPFHDRIRISVNKICSAKMCNETKESIAEIVNRIFPKTLQEKNCDRANIDKLLHEVTFEQTSSNFSAIVSDLHMQTTVLKRTVESAKRMSRRSYKQIYIPGIPFKMGDSGTCLYVQDRINPNRRGCIGLAIANHPDGGCIATPIMEILKYFQIRYKECL